jgi:type III pantothenate kinase
MILTLDVGNTNIHFGLYKNNRLTKTGKISLLKSLAEKKFLKDVPGQCSIEGVAIASVVPSLNPKFARYFKKEMRIDPLFVTPKLKMPVKIAYPSIGADRIANINAGFLRYHCNLLIFSFGTAVTGDVVSKNGLHSGGVILPGLETQLWSLHQRTALIKQIALKPPTRYIGRNTSECVQSGIFNGMIFCIQGFIKKIATDRRNRYRVIATGGWGGKMAQFISEIDTYDQDLTLYGILKLYKYNE